MHVLPTSLFHSPVCNTLLLFPLFVSDTLYPFQLCYWLQGFDSTSFCLPLFVPHFSGVEAFPFFHPSFSEEKRETHGKEESVGKQGSVERKACFPACIEQDAAGPRQTLRMRQASKRKQAVARARNRRGVSEGKSK